jgi:hypothetical protein
MLEQGAQTTRAGAHPSVRVAMVGALWVATLASGCVPRTLSAERDDPPAETNDTTSSSTTGTPPDPSTNPAESTATASTGTPAASTGGASTGDEMVVKPGEACDPVDPHCPAGQKCAYIPISQSPTSEPTTACVPDVGDGVAGDSCVHHEDSSDSCAAGFICWQYSLETFDGGRCFAFCDGEYNCEGDAECWASDLLSLCVSPCDPIAQDCGSGWGCYPQTDAGIWTCLRDYASEATGTAGAYGDPCPCANCCAAGNVCIDATFIDASSCGDSPGCCTVVCNLSDPIDCPGADEVCTPYYEAGNAPLGLEDLGLCVALQ